MCSLFIYFLGGGLKCDLDMFLWAYRQHVSPFIVLSISPAVHAVAVTFIRPECFGSELCFNLLQRFQPLTDLHTS